MLRSSRLQMFFEIGVLKNFANFKGKHLLESLFNKVASSFFYRTHAVAASEFWGKEQPWSLFFLFWMRNPCREFFCANFADVFTTVNPIRSHENRILQSLETLNLFVVIKFVSSLSQVLCRKASQKNFAKSTEKNTFVGDSLLKSHVVSCNCLY